MSRQGNYAASDPSGRNRTNINQNFKDLSKRFNNLKVNEKKKSKRNSLTDSDISDNAIVQSSSRSRGAGGGVVVNRSAVTNHHARALREIRSSLEPYAASDITYESVQNLAQELNVDQMTAEQYARNCPSLEAARQKLIQVLKKKMRDERQMHPAHLMQQQTFPADSQLGNMYPHTAKEIHNSTARGSPDGASLRAESPVFLGATVVAQVNNVRQMLVANPEYELQLRKGQRDQASQLLQHRYQMEPPPAYPTNYATYPNHISASPQSSFSDNGSNESVMLRVSSQRPPSPFQNTGKMQNYPNRSNIKDPQVGVGVAPGHVQQMVQRMSPSSPMPSGNTWVQQMSSVGVMSENHRPIIKGSSVASKTQYQTAMTKGSTNPQPSVGFSVPNLPAHPPPSYTISQQFRSTQKTAERPYSTASSEGHSRDVEMAMQEQNSELASRTYREPQWMDPVNGALMGNINYAAHPLSSSGSVLSSSPQSSISSNYQIIAEPCHASFRPLANPSILQPVNSKPVTKPQPMMADVPSNYEGIPGQVHMVAKNDGYDHGLQYQLKPDHYMSHRAPPPYAENTYSTKGSEDIQMSGAWDIENTFYSNPMSGDTGMPMDENDVAYMRRPPIVENYLNSVGHTSSNTNANSNKRLPTANPLPKGTEAAIQAARVTASNSKRHANSYSAVSAPKHPKADSTSELPGAMKPNEDILSNRTAEYEKKTIRTSPVPLRKKSAHKKGTKSNGSSSDSEEGSEEGSESSSNRQRTKRVKLFTPAAYKFFMEQHIENVIKGCRSRASRRMQLEQEMTKMNLPPKDQDQMRIMLFQKESNYMRLKRGKIDLSMFRIVKPLGVGAFGTVYLACKTSSGALYAVKTLRKKDVLKRNQVAHVKAERDILSEADNDWVVRLYYTFQDKQFLYFVMDYIPGGDMMSLLIKKGIFEEPLAQFYTAELTLALESVHKMGFIHRDIKPDNILIDRDGHIKLTDFGLCTGFRWTHDSKYYQKEGQGHIRQDSMDFSNEWKYGGCALKTLDRRRIRDANRHVARSLVGTPNYIAPEVLLREGYTQLCDWWSVGVILYEMVVGQPPFNANSPEETQLKVINWKKMLYFPETARLNRHTKDLILRLCCGQTLRLGCNGIDEIKQHPYFRNINWMDLRKMPAPHIPRISYPEDTSNFDPPDADFMLSQSQVGTMNGSNTLLRAGEHAFFEFTFRRFFDEDGRAYSSSHHHGSSDLTMVEEGNEKSSQYHSYNDSEWSQHRSGGMGEDEEEFCI